MARFVAVAAPDRLIEPDFSTGELVQSPQPWQSWQDRAESAQGSCYDGRTEWLGDVRPQNAMTLHQSCAFVLLVICGAMAQAPTRSSESLFAEADSAYKQGKTERAVQMYEQFLKMQPESVPARANLAVALVQLGRYEAAIAQYNLALQRAPGNPVLLLNLALARYKQGSFDQAASSLENVRRIEPANKQAIYLLADCYLRMGKNKDVISLLQPVYDVEPEDRAVEYALGMALLRDGQVQKSEVIIDRALRSGGHGEAELLVGMAQLAAGDAKTAVSTLRKAVQENPELPGAWSLYGRALINTDDRESARDALQKAIQADPNDFDANISLGGLLRHDGEIAEATPYLRKALQLRPRSIEARFQVGMLDLSGAKLEEARRVFEEIEREAPDFQQVHAQLALVYARLKQIESSNRERSIVLQLNEKARNAKDHQ